MGFLVRGEPPKNSARLVNFVSLASGESTENTRFRVAVYYNLNPTRIREPGRLMPAETIERSAFSDAPASIARNQTEIDEDNGERNVRLYSRSISREIIESHSAGLPLISIFKRKRNALPRSGRIAHGSLSEPSGHPGGSQGQS